MAATAHPVFYTFEQYVLLADESNVKLEYLDGNIYAMSGGTIQHARLPIAIAGMLTPALDRRGCRAYSSDLRVRVKATGLTTYPDLTIVCGKTEADQDNKDTVVNPTVLFEVTSPSTAKYDRERKLEHYRQIPSLRHYVVVSHEEHALDVWTRIDGDRWEHVVAREGDVADLRAIEARLDVAAVYRAAEG